MFHPQKKSLRQTLMGFDIHEDTHFAVEASVAISDPNPSWGPPTKPMTKRNEDRVISQLHSFYLIPGFDRIIRASLFCGMWLSIRSKIHMFSVADSLNPRSVCQSKNWRSGYVALALIVVMDPSTIHILLFSVAKTHNCHRQEDHRWLTISQQYNRTSMQWDKRLEDFLAAAKKSEVARKWRSSITR